MLARDQNQEDQALTLTILWAIIAAANVAHVVWMWRM